MLQEEIIITPLNNLPDFTFPFVKIFRWIDSLRHN